MSTASPRKKKNAATNPNDEVLTLSEAARYLRLSEDAVLEAVQRQRLPGRQVRSEWRFLKSAIQRWLEAPPAPLGNEVLARLAGAWKDDPNLEELLENVYRERGRPMVDDR